MYGKVFLCLALFAFVSVQLAESLKCYTCYNAETCKHSQLLECNALLANTTRDVLRTYYTDVKALNSNDFSCYSAHYTSNNVYVMDVRGCIMTGAIKCDSQLFNQTWSKQSCHICKKDLCNSVATISSSIVTVISLLALAKAFIA